MIIDGERLSKIAMLMEANVDGAAATAPISSAPAAPGAGEGDEKLLTQSQVNKILAEHKRGLKKEIEELRSVLNDKDSTIEELKTSQEEIATTLQELSQPYIEEGEEPPVNIDPNRPLGDIIKDMAIKLTDYENAIMELNEGFDTRLKDLESNLEKESSLREVAEEDALLAERDTVLQKALARSGCIDMEVGLKLFEDCCEIDEETGDWWVINDRTGEEWPLGEGVGKMLPDYLKKPLTSREGAASRGGTSGMNEIEKMKTRVIELNGEIITLQAEYQKSRNSNILASAQKLLRERNQLQRELRAAKV